MCSSSICAIIQEDIKHVVVPEGNIAMNGTIVVL